MEAEKEMKRLADKYGAARTSGGCHLRVLIRIYTKTRCMCTCICELLYVYGYMTYDEYDL